MIPLDIQLKRARLARAYWLQIPQNRVTEHLRFVTEGPDADLLYRFEGLYALRCKAAACLSGWLMTMPEFRAWARSRGLAGDALYAMVHIPVWLGLSDEGLVGSRDYWESGTDWDVALKRLDSLIAHLEAGQDASTWRNAPKGDRP